MSTAAAEVFDQTPYSVPEVGLSQIGDIKLDRLFSIEGRLGVMRYNRRICESLLAILAATLAFSATLLTGVESIQIMVAVPFLVVVVSASLVMICSTVKRLHDLGRSGWFYLPVMIPIVGAIYTLCYSFTPGKNDGNAYGEPVAADLTDKVLGSVGMVFVVAINVGALLSW